jgi:hypothetical protein
MTFSHNGILIEFPSVIEAVFCGDELGTYALSALSLWVFEFSPSPHLDLPRSRGNPAQRPKA